MLNPTDPLRTQPWSICHFQRKPRHLKVSCTAIQIENLEQRQLLTETSLSGLLSHPPQPVEVRTIDGTGNNLSNSEWGSTNEQFLRIGPAQYSDGISIPAGETRPSAREISNIIHAQGDVEIPSERLLSAMTYVWGQFIDHDLDLTQSGTTETLTIEVPDGDPEFDPAGTGTKSILTQRSQPAPGTGDSTSNPRQQVNMITSWMDGSMIYGSDEFTAQSLRTLTAGRLKTSAGNLLPVNDSATFPDGTIEMANVPLHAADDEIFAAGDVRANENLGLAAIQTLFVREHNRWADRIANEHPDWSDEQIYQKARSLVIAEVQSITYNEWIPAVLGSGSLERYRGYDPSVNPAISSEFATAGFRFGHSLLGNETEFLDDNGNPIAEPVELKDAFFNPKLVNEHGIDPLLKYLTSDPASELDTKVVEGVRNFLFGPPGSGGLDLASLNIERGRDHGIADFNTTRAAFGLPKVDSFSDITSDIELQSKLQTVYGSVDNIDLWVGALAEDHVRGASVGETLRAIMADQFERTRDADRFWYQRSLSPGEIQMIEGTTLSDIIERNTTLTTIQTNAFFDDSVLYFKTTHGPKSSHINIVVDQAETRIIDQSSGRILASGHNSEISQVTVVGQDEQVDFINIDTRLSGVASPQKFNIEGGTGPRDLLSVSGSPSRDQFQIQPGIVTINGRTIEHTGIEQIQLDLQKRRDRVQMVEHEAIPILRKNGKQVQKSNATSRPDRSPRVTVATSEIPMSIPQTSLPSNREIAPDVMDDLFTNLDLNSQSGRKRLRLR